MKRELADIFEEYLNDWYVRYLNNMRDNTLQSALPKYIFMGDHVKFAGYNEQVENFINMIDTYLIEYKKSKYPELITKDDEIMLNKEGR